MKRVPQGGKYADNLRKVLQKIKMPDGFKIELFAIVPDARNMAVSRNKATRIRQNFFINTGRY